jgi:hypothetical protein
MRETTDHKVYLLGLFGLTEHLIYDFNMNVHDTTYLWGQSMPFIADTVDSVQVLTGEYRKRIVISTPTFPGNDQWIEGVGSVYGLIYSVENTMVGETDTLICMSQNDVLIYHDVAVSTCNSPVQGIQPKAWSSFRIYPVPVQSTLTVELSDQELKQKESLNLVIINSMGETVKSMTVIGSKVVINVEMLPSGLYYAKLFNSSISEAVKFVKE